MTLGTVLVLPSDEPRHASLLGLLLNGDYAARVIHPISGSAPLPSRICAAINLAVPEPPLTLVGFGEACRVLPTVAFAQRTSHRRVAGYLLVDPIMPEVTESWPDAPVLVLVEDPDGDTASLSRLRGWSVAGSGTLADWVPEHD